MSPRVDQLATGRPTCYGNSIFNQTSGQNTTVDRSEIRRLPVEDRSFSHYSQGFYTSQPLVNYKLNHHLG